MDVKLIKVEDEFYNLVGKEDLELIASDDEAFQYNYKTGKLSTKNCQAIERGYDLDELAMGYDLYENINFVGQTRAYKAGFQKALKLMGDKKFSEEQLKVAADWYFETKGKKSIDEYIQSLKQTEWDVEVKMEKVIDETKIVGAVKGVKGSGNKITTYKSVPKLDADGCLILKRK